MNDPQESQYIESLKNAGASEEMIAKIMKHEGWSDGQVIELFASYYKEKTGVQVPVPSVSRGEAAKDAFLYLLSFATLGTWIFAIGSMAFTFINYWFPDTLRGYDYYSYSANSYSVSSELAAIIVAFPVYLFVMRILHKDLDRNSEKYDSPVRKWLTYLTLFIAAGVAIGDLITFLAFFLRGELTTRFLLKVITVLVLATGVFWYHLTSLKFDSKKIEASKIGEQGK